MKFNELAEVISKQTKVDEITVRRTLRATINFVKEQIVKEERFALPGLGAFVHREGKEPGQSRIILRLQKEKQAEDA